MNCPRAHHSKTLLRISAASITIGDPFFYFDVKKSFAKKTYDAKIQYIADHLKNFGALSLSTATPAAKTHAPTKMQSSLKQKPQHNVTKSLQLFFAAIGILLVFISVIFLILSHHRKNLLKEHSQNEH